MSSFIQIGLIDNDSAVNFGGSVSIDGNYIAVGDNIGQSVYVYMKDSEGLSPIQPQKITASDSELYGKNFGGSVSIDGDYLVVGDLGHTENGVFDSGAIYVYRRTGLNTWGEEFKIIASDGTPYDYFGLHVSISGDYMVAGAPFSDNNGNQSGAIYVYRRTGLNTWGDEFKITFPIGAFYFGWSVDINGDYIIVGAPSGFPINSPGESYLYRRIGPGNVWGDEFKITPSDGINGDEYGYSVAIDGIYAIIGARSRDVSGVIDVGTAYVYKRDENSTNFWGEEQQIFGDITTPTFFGNSVSISGDYIIVGAHREKNTGAVFIFKRIGFNFWEKEQRIFGGQFDQAFGYVVSIDGDHTVVGDTESNYVYLFENTELPSSESSESDDSEDGVEREEVVVVHFPFGGGLVSYELENPNIFIPGSSSSSSMSSSSFGGPETRGLWSALVQQTNYNLLPFSFVAERGIEGSNAIGNTLTFEIESSNSPNFNYEGVIGNVSSSVLSYESDVYVPKDEKELIDHREAFHVEIFAKDDSGIKDYNIRVQEEINGYEKPKYVYTTPKFSWNTDISFYNNVSSEVATSEIGFEGEDAGGVWVGTTNNKFYRVQYDAFSGDSSPKAVISYQLDVVAEPYSIVFEKEKADSFLTTFDYIIKFSIDDYPDFQSGSIVSELKEDLTLENFNSDIVVLSEGEYFWSTQSYSGKILKRLKSDFSIVEEYSGFDSPYKMVWSSYHKKYFIAGTHIVWTLDLYGNKDAVYHLEGYSLVDIDVSSDGYLCCIFDGNNQDIIRILNYDLKEFLFNELIFHQDGIARNCLYCDQGIFYVLVELVNDNDTYNIDHYLFDTRKITLEIIPNEISSEAYGSKYEEESTTSSVDHGKVTIQYPEGGEWINVGDEVNISWKSSESVSDEVKIELYRGGVFDQTIVSRTTNTGIYVWQVSSDIENGKDYQISITWLSSASNVGNSDLSEFFTITDIIATSTTSTTTKGFSSSIGIDFNPSKRHVVNVLKDGLIGIFDLKTNIFGGFFDASIGSSNCMGVRDDSVRVFSNISAVRIFVGSEKNLSDKWDSGIIETTKTSMYYGGGNNLEPGKTYYVNMQLYDQEYGWSYVQTKKIKMPR